MGPRFCKRGNLADAGGLLTLSALQWGHAFVSVETSPAPNLQGSARTSLQWGHAFVSVETAAKWHWLQR